MSLPPEFDKEEEDRFLDAICKTGRRGPSMREAELENDIAACHPRLQCHPGERGAIHQPHKDLRPQTAPGEEEGK